MYIHKKKQQISALNKSAMSAQTASWARACQKVWEKEIEWEGVLLCESEREKQCERDRVRERESISTKRSTHSLVHIASHSVMWWYRLCLCQCPCLCLSATINMEEDRILYTKMEKKKEYENLVVAHDYYYIFFFLRCYLLLLLLLFLIYILCNFCFSDAVWLLFSCLFFSLRFNSFHFYYMYIFLFIYHAKTC